MFVFKAARAGFWRALAVAFFTTAFTIVSGMTNTAMADRQEAISVQKSENLKTGKKSAKARKPKHRSLSLNKARRSVNRTVKHSIRRLPRPKYTGHKARQKHRGLHPRLSRLLSIIKRHYRKPLIISSGCRSHRHNRRVGGARRSMHLRCMAADFKIVGVSKASLRRYVSRLPGRGGIGTYCGRSIVHLDVGPRRSWHHGCRKRRNRRS